MFIQSYCIMIIMASNAIIHARIFKNVSLIYAGSNKNVHTSTIPNDYVISGNKET